MAADCDGLGVRPQAYGGGRSRGVAPGRTPAAGVPGSIGVRSGHSRLEGWSMSGLSRRTVLGGIAEAAAITGLPAGAAVAGGGPVRAVRLTTGQLADPLGVGLDAPRFGWQLRAEGNGRAQSAYRIVVGTTPGAADVWDSGQVDSSEQTGQEVRRTGAAGADPVPLGGAGLGRARPARSAERPAWFETALAGDGLAGRVDRLRHRRPEADQGAAARTARAGPADPHARAELRVGQPAGRRGRALRGGERLRGDDDDAAPGGPGRGGRRDPPADRPHR